MYTNMLFIESPYPIQCEVQFLPKSGRNVIVCCIDRPCICIGIVLLYFQSTCANKMRIQFTILLHLKTTTAATFNSYQVWECLLGSFPSFDHNITATNFKSSPVQPEIGENCYTRPSCLHATYMVLSEPLRFSINSIW